MENRENKKTGIEMILKESFGLWRKTLGYQMIFSVLYFSLFFIFGWVVFNYLGLTEELMKISKLMKTDVEAYKKAITAFSERTEFRTFALVSVGIRALLFPLNVGFYQLYRKIDQKQPFDISDLFVGFEGFGFIKFASYAFFWGMTSLVLNSFLPMAIIWPLLTIFVTPLMFFMNKNITEGFLLNVKALKINFLTILICSGISVLFSYGGLLLFGLGLLFTFPFWNAIIYTMYKHFFREMPKN